LRKPTKNLLKLNKIFSERDDPVLRDVYLDLAEEWNKYQDEIDALHEKLKLLNISLRKLKEINKQNYTIINLQKDNLYLSGKLIIELKSTIEYLESKLNISLVA